MVKLRNRFLSILFLLSLSLCLWLGHSSVRIAEVATAQSPEPTQIVQRGIDLYQAGKFRAAIAQWQTALKLYQESKNSAHEVIVQENLARAYEKIGQSDRAIMHWESAIAHYRHSDRQSVGRLLTEKAQSYTNLGQPRKAIALLCAEAGKQTCDRESALHIAREYKNSSSLAAALGSLGNAYRLTGEYEQAIATLQSSLKIANDLNNLVYQTSSLNSLGNAYSNLAKVNYRRANSAEQRGDADETQKYRQIAIQNDTEALKHFQTSLALAQTQKDNLAQLRVFLNSITPLRRIKTEALAEKAAQQALALLLSIPDSKDKVYAAINLANLVQSSEQSHLIACAKSEKQSQSEKLIHQAIAIARQLQDPRSESFALGQLGHIYECRQDYRQALNFTKIAQLAADQALNSKDSLYLWEWQAGRIFKAQNQISQATQAYEQAVTTLEAIRANILTENRDLQLDFRDAVDSIYREFSQLRLEQASLPTIEPKQRSQFLNSALITIDLLQLAELQNYFGNECILPVPDRAKVDLARAVVSGPKASPDMSALSPALSLDKSLLSLRGVDKTTAMISSIIFKEHTAIVVRLPNGEKKLAWIDVDSKSLRQTINKFRRGLERYRDFSYNPAQAQNLYNWIIRPFAADLDNLHTKTIVFMQDGILRSIPMAALHDGERFLVQKYAIATTPSLTLTKSKNQNRAHLRVLALGLTKEAKVNGRFFSALSQVATEISQVDAQIPGSKQLVDENFTRDRLLQELSQTSYPIIHIATHGEFGTAPEDTFLVTGNNDKLTITDLDTAIRNISRSSDSIELLVLTACRTAVGDDRSALGLAGVAVQAGASSALATLWFIQDAPTATLIAKFYDLWYNSGVSKAEALRAAQQTLITSGGQYAHPAYWAPFILIGNWL